MPIGQLAKHVTMYVRLQLIEKTRVVPVGPNPATELPTVLVTSSLRYFADALYRRSMESCAAR